MLAMHVRPLVRVRQRLQVTDRPAGVSAAAATQPAVELSTGYDQVYVTGTSPNVNVRLCSQRRSVSSHTGRAGTYQLFSAGAAAARGGSAIR